MFDFHKDTARYFDIQYEVTLDFIIPFIKESGAYKEHMNVLEIGCAEAGVLKAFLVEGHEVTGIELSEHRAERARVNLKEWISKGKAQIICKNIYHINPDEDLENKFDLILLKDVIEHIPDQEKFIPLLRQFLNPDGVVFFGYPPWYMPFGGHQQICKSKWLSRLPWFHLLPLSVYKGIAKWAGESDPVIKELEELTKTGITIERLNSILRSENFTVVDRKYWLFNPIYQWKFNLKPREVPQIFTKIPFLRNFYTTAKYILFTT